MKTYYEDDYVKILHGDNREILPQLGAFDCVITSPPYNLRLRLRNGKYIKRMDSHHSQKYKNFSDALSMDEYFEQQKFVIERCLQRSPLVFANIQLATGNKTAWLQLMGFFAEQIRDIVIWDKKKATPAANPGVLSRRAEFILAFERSCEDGGKALGRTFERFYFEKGSVEDVWPIKTTNSGDPNNSAAFPLDLAYKILNNWTIPLDMVLDPWGGIGTTALAAKNLSRHCVLIEIDEKCCEIAANRCRQESLEF